MKALWRGSWRLVRKVLLLVTLVLVSSGILLLTSGLRREPIIVDDRMVGSHFEWHPEVWWNLIQGHAEDLLHGKLEPSAAQRFLLPPLASREVYRPSNQPLAPDLAAAVPITLKLVGTAFVLSVVLGTLLGVLLSMRAPPWLRAPLWLLTTAVHSVPDLVMASVLDLSLVFVSIITGRPTGVGSGTWQKYEAPSIALALLAVPYIARLTAAAIDEIAVQEYIRAAVARGIHPVRVLFVHIGKHVLIRMATALPAVAGLLVSGAAVVEYFTEVHGAGRAMLIVASKWGDGYEATLYLMPLLAVFVVLYALAEGSQRLLDPRMSDELVAMAQHGGGPVSWRERRDALRPSRLWGALRDFGTGAAHGIRDRVVSLPALAVRWVRALKDPVLLAGVLLVAGLIAVAVFAAHIAPFDPERRAPLVEGSLVNVPPMPPSSVYRLGLDDRGRDILSRLIFGTRYALLLAMLVVPVRFALAVVAGLLAAFRRGIWEKGISLLGTFFTAVPQVIIPLVLIQLVNILFQDNPGRMLLLGVLVIALPGIPRMAGVIRQQSVAVLAEPYVEGALAAGATPGRTMFRHVLPQLAPQLVTMFALEVPSVLTLTAVLGYFGANVGGVLYDTQNFKPIAPLLPEWGSLMEPPFMLLMASRWYKWAPFAALFAAVLAFNLLGEGLRRQWASRTGWRWS